MTRYNSLGTDTKLLVSSDANFILNRFPCYTLGANNMIIEKNDDPLVPSLKEIVAMETIQLIEQQKRLSVRVLAEKFENGLAMAAKLSNEERWKENVPLDRHVLLKNLRDLLKSLKGRVAGSNKDDVEESISMVEALAFQITQSEGNLIQEKSEIKSLAASLKKATEDAKKIVEEERAFAHDEIECARKAVHRVEQTLKEQEEMSRASDKQERMTPLKLQYLDKHFLLVSTNKLGQLHYQDITTGEMVANFQTRQRREKEVHALMDKLQPETIMLNPGKIGTMLASTKKEKPTEQEIQEEKEAAVESAKSIKMKKKTKGRSKPSKKPRISAAI